MSATDSLVGQFVNPSTHGYAFPTLPNLRTVLIHYPSLNPPSIAVTFCCYLRRRIRVNLLERRIRKGADLEAARDSNSRALRIAAIREREREATTAVPLVKITTTGSSDSGEDEHRDGAEPAHEKPGGVEDVAEMPDPAPVPLEHSPPEYRAQG